MAEGADEPASASSSESGAAAPLSPRATQALGSGGATKQCAACGRIQPSKRNRCVQCGAALPDLDAAGGAAPSAPAAPAASESASALAVSSAEPTAAEPEPAREVHASEPPPAAGASATSEPSEITLEALLLAIQQSGAPAPGLDSPLAAVRVAADESEERRAALAETAASSSDEKPATFADESPASSSDEKPVETALEDKHPEKKPPEEVEHHRSPLEKVLEKPPALEKPAPEKPAPERHVVEKPAAEKHAPEKHAPEKRFEEKKPSSEERRVEERRLEPRGPSHPTPAPKAPVAGGVQQVKRAPGAPAGAPGTRPPGSAPSVAAGLSSKDREALTHEITGAVKDTVKETSRKVLEPVARTVDVTLRTLEASNLNLGKIVKAVEALAQDAQKRRKDYDVLHGEMRDYKANFIDVSQRPLYMDLLLLFDAMQRIERRFDESAGAVAREEALKSINEVKDQLLEILYRRDVEPIPDRPARLDVKFQKPVRRIEVTDPAEDRMVVQVVREGFRRGQIVFRPQEVVVKRCVTTPSDEGPIPQDDPSESGTAAPAAESAAAAATSPPPADVTPAQAPAEAAAPAADAPAPPAAEQSNH